MQPHFLFNTRANVRALVKAASPQAPAVLDSLIAYLRAAVPSLSDEGGTLAKELQLVRAYLEPMHMRMPDRLQFSVHADEAALGLRESGQGSGTGLETLRERMQLAFGDTQLRLSGTTPHGVCAELEFPAQRGAA